MIIALFALSLAMIIGGIASVVQGFPYVRLESGLAMTIAGATVASAGAVLLGLAVLAGQVRTLGRRPAGAVSVPPVAEVATPTAASVDPAEAASPSARRPLIVGAAGLAAGAAGASYLGGEVRGRPEPAFAASFEEPPLDGPLPSPPEPLFTDPVSQDLDGREFPERDPANVDFLLLPPEPRIDREPEESASPEPAAPEPISPAATAEPEPEMDLFAPPESPPAEPASEAASETPALRPALDDEAPANAEPTPALAVVGTYVSGGNTYVMFSDGSIEADTPRGRFTFESLDELKAFVEAGGEGDSRGAA